MRFSYDIRLPMSWSWIESVRRMVATGLADADEAMRDAAIMVASELAENVVKYGEPTTEDESGHVELVADDDSLIIRSKNGVPSERGAAVCALIDRISSAADPAALYMARLQVILENPDLG